MLPRHTASASPSSACTPPLARSTPLAEPPRLPRLLFSRLRLSEAHEVASSVGCELIASAPEQGPLSGSGLQLEPHCPSKANTLLPHFFASYAEPAAYAKDAFKFTVLIHVPCLQPTHHLGTWTLRICSDILSYPDLSRLIQTYPVVKNNFHG
jgi:hypothetical protein